MKYVFYVVVLAALSQVHARHSVHMCSCLEQKEGHHRHNVSHHGCDPEIRLKRLQIGRVTSPGVVNFKYKLQVDRDLPHPHVDFILSKFVALPCMGGYGSCAYSLCGFEQLDIEKKICAGWGCQCPVKAGTYYSGLVSINMPDMRGFGPAAYGPVDVKIKFREGKKVIHCTRFKIHVVYPENATEHSRADSDFKPSSDMIDART